MTPDERVDATYATYETADAAALKYEQRGVAAVEADYQKAEQDGNVDNLKFPKSVTATKYPGAGALAEGYKSPLDAAIQCADEMIINGDVDIDKSGVSDEYKKQLLVLKAERTEKMAKDRENTEVRRKKRVEKREARTTA